MDRWPLLLTTLLLALSPPGASGQERKQVKLKTRSPLSGLDSMRKRMGFDKDVLKHQDARYELANETFEVFLPKGLTKANAARYGVIVWISPSESGSVSAEWEQALNSRRIIAIGANRSGNGRHMAVRLGLALDALYGVSERYSINSTRVYVGGFSGGAKVASFIALHYSNHFHGAIYVGGQGYFKTVPLSDGRTLPAFIPKPAPKQLRLARQRSRHVYVCGEHDEWFPMMKDQVRFIKKKKEGFRRVLFVPLPGKGHELPSARPFLQAMSFLEKPPANPAKGKKKSQ